MRLGKELKMLHSKQTPDRTEKVAIDVLPNSKETERGLLGRLLRGTGLDEVSRLRPKHFFDNRNEMVFSGILGQRRRGEPYDAVSVTQYLRDNRQLESAGGAAYIASLLDQAGTIPSLGHYVQTVLVKARDRALLRQLDSLRNLLISEPPSDSRRNMLLRRLTRTASYDIRGTSPETASQWKHADLIRADLKPIKWIVQDLVVDGGVTVLGGKKKVGKSWLALQGGHAVASGAKVLDRATSLGPVLFLCLEDGPRRLKDRLLRQKAPPDLPIHYVTRFTHLDRGGMEELRALAGRIRPKFIIIDTLAAAKTNALDENSAGDMADVVNGLRHIAQDLDLGILIVAHHGKQTRSDPGDDIRGSSAIAAAADLNLGLYRHDGKCTLKAEGRDIESTEWRVEFDSQQTWSWHLVGDARELARSESEAEIIEALRVLGEADAESVAKAVGKTRPAVQMVLKRLRDQRRISWKPSGDSSRKILYGLWEPEDEKGEP